jgi:protein-S-isoprenylcysteine O-methyltransferase Ste14
VNPRGIEVVGGYVAATGSPTDLPMRATDFEFRHRFWIIGAAFAAGFGLYAVDPLDSVERLLGWVVPGTPEPERLLLLKGTFVAGAALVFLAALVRTWATAYLRSDVVFDTRLHAERLVADGPFRHVRNPLYLGSILMAAGMAPLASLPGAVVLVMAIVLIFVRLIGREEYELASTQGAAFQRYLSTVPRLVPALAPRVPSSGVPPRWWQAVWGEIFVWMFAVGTLAIALTLNSRVGTGVWVAGFVLHLLQKAASRPNAATGSRESG